ncbi:MULTISPECIES: MOSC domain-containing protein [unclassified Streptomyces]|uniref:MOSC domain-containing protein n=1 Tax=unclassified Streptomyces TaxID=2593676 RepID=UPI001654E6A9|nr:MOSC domain-containing protein [Streptomyces sp. CB02980]MCB8904128.1 MOSC domain-containing protein [Streptomyces sp. CB02980]
MTLLSVNVGRAEAVDYTEAASGLTAIDKRPVEGPVRIEAPGAPGVGRSGLAGDTVCDLRFHGGDDRAAYAFAREDLDRWERELGRPLANGSFGENLTTADLDVNGALIGERWRIGEEVVLEVTGGRIPCRTFAGFLEEKGWVKRFTQSEAGPGALLRVIVPGEIRAGDPITVVHRPDHDITVALLHRAATTERTLLPRTLVAAEWMESGLLALARQYAEKYARA